MGHQGGEVFFQPGQQAVREVPDGVLDLLGQVGQPLAQALAELVIGLLDHEPHLVPVLPQGGQLRPAFPHQGGQQSAQGAQGQEDDQHRAEAAGKFPPVVEKPQQGFGQPGAEQGQQERHSQAEQGLSCRKHQHQQGGQHRQPDGQPDPEPLTGSGAQKGVRGKSFHTKQLLAK